MKANGINTSLERCRKILLLYVIAFLLAVSHFSVHADNTNELQISLTLQRPNVRLQWPSQSNETFQIEHRSNLVSGLGWQALSTNWPATTGATTQFIHTNALTNRAEFYRLIRLGTSAPPFTFNWDGTNFTYTDAQRSFTGIMLKPTGAGPFPGVIINHGAGGTANGYSLAKAREMSAWGMVCIGPTLTHVAGGETNAVNMGNCPENIARATACANVLGSFSYVDTNRLALFGHSMGAFATIGDAAALGSRIRAATITAGGVIVDSAGTTNAAPTVSEATPIHIPFLMFHCDADPVVPPARSLLFQQMLNSNAIGNQRILYSSNSIPNTNSWHNIHQDTNINADVLMNTFQWFKNNGVLP